MFTKWVKKDKLDACIAYLTGAIARAAYASSATPKANAAAGVAASLLAVLALIAEGGDD